MDFKSMTKEKFWPKYKEKNKVLMTISPKGLIKYAF